MEQLVAAIRRKSIGMGFELPTGSTSLSCKTRNIFDCICKGISPISSKKSVPLLANRNFPGFPFFLEPVKAPSSYPNNSDSSKFSGIEAQFTLIKGPSLYLLNEWMALVNTSFPTPLSPVIKIDAEVCAARLAMFLACVNFSLFPMTWLKV